MLVLCVGAGDGFGGSLRDLPSQFRELLVAGRIDTVCCTDHVGEDSLDYLSTLSPNVHSTPGRGDIEAADTSAVRTGNGVGIVMVAGRAIPPSTRSLRSLAMRHGASIIVSSSGAPDVCDVGGVLVVRVGSLLGNKPSSPGSSSQGPYSFQLLDIGQEGRCVCYTYRLTDLSGQVDIAKKVFSLQQV
ncbi:unnamed protein product [Pedinophyceae sp. YPF-701]|nr:unnamed protein product [Pedinophyceae sp. YPF-701]